MSAGTRDAFADRVFASVRASRVVSLVISVAALSIAAPAQAAEPTIRAEDAHGDQPFVNIPDDVRATVQDTRIRPDAKLPGYMQLFVTTFIGDGLRFNNPYRLATPLGNDAESVSVTAPYVDVGLGATFGGALGFSHGFAFRTSFATTGVKQAVLVPSYLLYRRFSPRVAGYGRAGVSIVASPEATWGGEVGAGAIVYVRGGIGVAAELVGDWIYGAGTRDVAVTSYPLLSGQLGIVAAYEVFP